MFMKIAVLSDIHSNIFALEAVINDALANNVDCLVNLGDILYGPIAPKATYELLKKHNFITISGNQDRQIYEATAEEIASNPTMQFILHDLGQEPLDWMKSLPFDFQLSDEVYLCHGTPSNDLIYLLEDVSLGYAKLRSTDEILTLLNGQQSPLVLCGHTHTPRTVKLNDHQLVINPGSVGLQAYTDDAPVLHSMENYCSQACYAIVEKSEFGWKSQHIKVPYNTQAAIEACKLRGRLDWVHFLSTGRKL